MGQRSGISRVQIPSWDSRLIDLNQAAQLKQYCDDLKGRCNGLAVIEIFTHLQGQLVAVHPAYDIQFNAFAPKELHDNPKARQEWAVSEVIKAIKASSKPRLSAMPTFSAAH